MASHGHDALCAKLYELELQLAAYKLLRAARGGEVGAGGDGAWEHAAGGTTCCRGRQYDAYMRRRDARRVGVVAAEAPAKGEHQHRRAGGGRPSPLTLKCAARDTQEVGRTPAVSIPATPRKENGALPRSRTVSSGASAARSHHRRNSVAGVPADFGDCATPRPFLRRGSGTGGAAARLRTPRVHDLALISDVSSSSTPRQPPHDHFTQVAAERRHLRSVSELPFHTTAAMYSPRSVAPPQARTRKRWGSPETPPPAIFSSASTSSHNDLAKGLRKLLSFVRKSKSTEQQHIPARSGGGGRERDSGGKPVKGWAAATACSVLDGPFDRASLEGHQFPMTQAVGTS